MKRLFTSRSIVPKAYKLLLDKELGPEWVTWLPETLYTEIEKTWGVFPSQDVSDKLMAIATFHTTDLFYHDAAAFEHIVRAVNDAVFNPNTLELSLPEEIAYAIQVLQANPKKFEREILAYIKACCKDVGLLVYPPSLAFAQPKYENELALLASKIRPENSEPSETDSPLVVQSRKLFRAVQAIGQKLSEMDIETLMPSVE